jgi:hypothetical protein
METKPSPPSRGAAVEREPSRPGPAIKSALLRVEPKTIMLFKAIIESYDNLATLRTEDPTRHHLRLYYGVESEAEVMDLLARVADQFSLQRIG